MINRVIKMAVIQMSSKMLEKEHNVSRSIELLQIAVNNGAKLIVLPELCTSGYVFKSVEEAASSSEPIPGGFTTKSWSEFAIKNEVYVVGGVCERSGDILYNSAVLVGPEGHMGAYRKTHLWGEEKLWFKPGNGFKVFDSSIGKIGVMICYDSYFPEVPRILTRMGAEVICQPYATTDEYDFVINETRSFENVTYIGAANMVGEQRGLRFVGHSQITNPKGKLLVKEMEEREIVLTVDIDLSEITKGRQLGKHNNIITDRRTDLYDDFLGYHAPR